MALLSGDYVSLFSEPPSVVPAPDRPDRDVPTANFRVGRKVIPAVVAPLVLAEFHAEPALVGVNYGISAAASLLVQMGCGSFIARYGALRMSQVALVLLGGSMALAAEGGLLRIGASAIVSGGGGAISTRPARNWLAGFRHPAWRRWCLGR